MNRRVFTTLILMASMGRSISSAAPAKEADAPFPPEIMKLISKKWLEYCEHLEKGAPHAIYIVPKLMGRFDNADPFGGGPRAGGTGAIGYFRWDDVKKLTEGLKTPYRINQCDCSCEYQMVPLMTLSPTAKDTVLELGMLQGDAVFVRFKIPDIEVTADLFYDNSFSAWIKQRMVTAKGVAPASE